MIKGWTNKGKYIGDGKTVLFRIEQDGRDVYLFIFSSDLEILKRDELHNSVESAKKSADGWGASEEWKEEVWKISFSDPPECFNVASFYDKRGVKISEYLREDSYYIE